MKYRSLSKASLSLFFLASLAQAGTEFPAKPGEQVVPLQFLVKMKQGVQPASVVPSFVPGAWVRTMTIPDVYLVQVPSNTSDTTISALAAHVLVDFVEPNRIRHTSVQAPNDPGLPNQWALQTVQAQQAWSLFPNQYLTAATAGTNRVKVAIIDTGVDCTHPDFINSGGTSTNSALGGQLLWSASQAAADTPTTISPATCPWQDDYGHGTHVAGIVAAATENATGIASLGYPLQIIVFKVLDNTGSGSDSDVSSAIIAAANAGAQVISLSLTGQGYSQTMQQAVNYAWQHNSLVVAAAGNATSSDIYYPADATFAVGVSALAEGGGIASYSNFGNGVAVAAPGSDVYSTLPTYPVTINGTNYGFLSGTSMATPHVSALAGLLAMISPNTSAAAILQRIQQSAASTIPNGGWDFQGMGYGVINAYNALSGTLRTATLGSLIGQIIDNNANPVTGAQITVNSQSLTVDSSGLYRFPNLPAGTYTVSVTATGFTAVNLTATVAPGADTTLPVVMGVQYGRFTGTVTDHGVAVPGAIVQASSGGLIMATAVAGSSGQYSLWVPGGGTFSVMTSGIARSTTTLTGQTVAAGGTTTINLTAPTLGTIAGVVTDTSSNPISNAQITIAGGNVGVTTGTAANGSYATVPLAARSYTLTFSAVGFQTFVSNVTASADGVTTLNVQMAPVSVPWYSNGGTWTSRTPVTISHGQVSGTGSLTNFPVLVSVTNANLKTVGNGGSVAQSNGNDILFTAGDGLTKLNHEIESYNAATGQLIAWVQVPSVSPVTDTLIYAYYGGAGAGNQQNAAGVWDSNYKIVNHLNQASGAVLDSTGNGNNATASPSGATYVAAGEIGGAYSFDGVNGLLTTPYSATWSGSFSNYTVQMWLKFGTGVQNYEAALSAGGWGGPLNIWTYPSNGTNSFTIGTSGGGCATSSTTPVTTDTVNFHQLGMSYDASAGKLTMYVDGAAVGQTTCSGTTSLGTAALVLGGFSNFKLLPSTIDELRVSTATRSSDWILTEYRNQNSPGTFVTLGTQQQNSGGGSPPAQVVAPAFNPVAGTYTSATPVTISTTTMGATIRYTTDGVTVPSETVGTVFTTSFTVSSNTTVMAIAYKTGMADSTVTTAAYTINVPSQVVAPAFNPVAGTYTSATPVTISTTTMGATIRYTTDGVTVPSETVGTVFTTSFTVSSNTTVMAIAYKTGMTDSAVTTAVYTINVSGPAWYSTGGTWTSRAPVTISHGQVSGGSSLMNFPVLVSVTNANLKTVGNGGSVGQSNGNDILFTAGDGLTKLNHEVESYNAATGQLIAWVQVPSLSASTDTSLYVYYGNATAANQQVAAGVWDSNYLGVWHMTAGEKDSTSNGNNVTTIGGTAASGEIGSGVSYSGSQHDTLPGPGLNAYPYAWTLSGWVKFTGVSGDGYGGLITQSGSEGLFINQRSGSYHVNFYGVGGDHASTGTLSPSTWYYVTAVNNAGTLSMYINGVLDSTFTAVNEPFTVTYFGGDPGENLAGTVDEMRASRSVRPPGWIATEYNNQNSPGTFVTLGTQQQNSGGGSPPAQVVAPAFNPVAGTYTSATPVTISTTTMGATIRYTTDGVTVPSETVGTVFTTSFTVSSNTTVMAIAYKTGMADSTVTTAAYTINVPSQVVAPAFNPVAGTYTSATPVTISTTTMGATIRYTTDGVTVPSETVGTVFTTSFTVSSNTTVMAIAYKTGMTDSAVTTAVYTINVSGPAWYSTGGTWTSRAPVTISHGQVSGGSSLMNFPVLVSVTNANLKTVGNGGSVGQSNGNDILFTAGDGLTKLNHEVESYNAATGQLIAWVQVPSLSASTDTSLYVYYGNATAANQQVAAGVWDSNYLGVWHMTAGEKDSTSNGNNVTTIGGTAASGEIGSGVSYSGSQHDTLPGPGLNAYPYAWTLSGWVKFTGVSGDGYGGLITQSGSEGLFINQRSGSYHVNFYGVGGDHASTGTLSPSTWYYVTAVNNAGTLSMYINGVLDSTFTAVNEPFTVTYFGGDPGENLAGTVDEMRASRSVRPPGWIATEYNNQNSPGTFVTLGTQQQN